MFRDWAQQRTRELGKRQRELADLLHIDPSGVSRLLAGERQLTASEIPLVARFFEVSVDELLALLGGAPALAPPPPAAMPASAAAELSVLSRAEMPRDVPVFGTAVGGKDGYFVMNGDVVDYVRRPPSIVGVKSIFAIYTQGESMRPWREPGDPVYVHPSRPARPGDYVVVELIPAREGEPGVALLKKLIARTPTKLRLAQYNPPDDRIEVDLAKVKAIFRVIDWPELLGA